MSRERIIGSIIGVIFAALVLAIGFWKTFFIGLAAIIGFYIIGEKTSYKEKVLDVLDKFLSLRGEFIGVILGLVFAVLVLIIGFWKTLFIGICIVLGYYIGKKFSTKDDILEFLDRILPPGKM